MDIIYLTFGGLRCLEQYSLGGSMWARGEKDFSEAKKTTYRRFFNGLHNPIPHDPFDPPTSPSGSKPLSSLGFLGAGWSICPNRFRQKEWRQFVLDVTSVGMERLYGFTECTSRLAEPAT